MKLDKLTERQLWALLWDAEVMSEVACREHNGELALQFLRVGSRARLELIQRFHLNLDDITQETRELTLKLLKEEQEKDEQEKLKAKALEEIFFATDPLADHYHLTKKLP